MPVSECVTTQKFFYKFLSLRVRPILAKKYGVIEKVGHGCVGYQWVRIAWIVSGDAQADRQIEVKVSKLVLLLFAT